MRHATVALLVFGAALAGCQAKGGGEPRVAPNVQVWRPRPVAIRVYPSTRFVRDGDQALLEARVELSDEMGDPMKAPGEFRIELFSDQSDRQLYAWRVQALTFDEQKLFYDPITRAYLMRLKLDPAALVEGEPRLRVAFTPAEGPRLQAEASVRLPR